MVLSLGVHWQALEKEREKMQRISTLQYSGHNVRVQSSTAALPAGEERDALQLDLKTINEQTSRLLADKAEAEKRFVNCAPYQDASPAYQLRFVYCSRCQTQSRCNIPAVKPGLVSKQRS